MHLTARPIRLTWEGKERTRAPRAGRLVELDRHPKESPVRLIQGDNWSVLRALHRELGGRVALAYLDPPFWTGREFARVERRRDPNTGKVLRDHHPAFDDRWTDLGSYLENLADRLRETRAMLLPEGCVVVHVDPRTSHYVKIVCDEIFGQDAFASEIVWRYRRWPTKTPNFQRVHDVLLRYVRDPSATPRFYQLYEPLAPSTLATWGKQKQRALVVDGRRTRSTTLAEQSPGTPMGDVWEIGIVAPVARERTGYPTQKPLELLRRLVTACTREGDWVLDPYAGSGTTLAAAAGLGRRAVGIDESPVAMQVAKERLAAMGVSLRRQRFEVEAGVPERAAGAGS
jgi:DNA modification methylase